MFLTVSAAESGSTSTCAEGEVYDTEKQSEYAVESGSDHTCALISESKKVEPCHAPLNLRSKLGRASSVEFLLGTTSSKRSGRGLCVARPFRVLTTLIEILKLLELQVCIAYYSIFKRFKNR